MLISLSRKFLPTWMRIQLCLRQSHGFIGSADDCTCLSYGRRCFRFTPTRVLRRRGYGARHLMAIVPDGEAGDRAMSTDDPSGLFCNHAKNAFKGSSRMNRQPRRGYVAK